MLQAELETLESRVFDPIAGRLDALGDRLAHIEQSSADERLDEVAGALVRLGERFDEVTNRLSELSDRPDENAAGDRESESVEELQETISQLHARLAQVEPVAAEPQPAHDLSYVAFVATSSGYTLVEQESPPPPVGSELELPAVDGRFRVVRIGRSPLPLDRRCCAYLEPLQH